MGIPPSYAAVLDVLADATIATDETGRILFINRAGAALLGWPAEELVGASLTTIMPARMRAAHEAGLRRFLTTHVPRILGRPVRLPALRRDGVEIDIELALAAVTTGAGHELVIALLRDLRDRVELERQLTVTRFARAATRAAAELTAVLDLEHVLRTAVGALAADFDAALARIWLVDPERRSLELRASDGFSRRTEGSSRQHVDIATHPLKLGVVARSRAPFVKNGLLGDPEFDQAWVEKEGVKAAVAFPLVTSGELSGVMVAFFRHRLEDEVFEVLGTFAAMVATAIDGARLYKDAQGAARLRDEVLAVVSHDLRSPLAAVGMAAALLRRRTDDDDCIRHLERIERSVGRMDRLIGDLLDISAIDAGGLKTEAVEHAVQSIAAEACDANLPAAQEKGIRLVCEAIDPAAKVPCDRSRVLQVLSNLLGNALKFTPSGGVVTLGASVEPTRVVFSVADTGIGIPEDARPHVFDRYWQGHGGRKGVGLGLAIAKGIVEAHGGAIWVRSAVGAGSTFSFALPTRRTRGDAVAA
jgi:PAS domain S-box-containing protein